jgi:hypothetical protein
VRDCDVSGNSGTSRGGGIFASGMLMVEDSMITGNSAGIGGGLDVLAGSLTLVDSTVADNRGGTYHPFGGGYTSGTGGGVVFESFVGSIIGCNIIGNSAAGPGGGVVVSGGSLTLIGSTIADNSAGGRTGIGGGLLQVVGSIQLTDSTIANNTAAQGGGIFIAGGALTIADSTISGNRANTAPPSWFPLGSDSGGGLEEVDFAGPAIAALVENSIVANNCDPNAPDDIDGPPLSTTSANNLVGVDNTGSLTNGVNGNIVGTQYNPMLGPLQNNGGPTDTMALLPGSPAIGAGSTALIAVDPATGLPIATDQRGEPRTVNGMVDIGAYEAQDESTTTTVTAAPSTSVAGQFVTFTATVAPQTGGAVPAGTVQFEINGSDFGSPVPLVNASATSTAISSLSVGSYAISAVYTSDSTADFSGSMGSTSITVDPLTPTNLQSVVTAAQSSGTTVTLAATTTGTLTSVLGTISGLAPSTTGAVVVDLSNNVTYQQQDSSGNTVPIDASAPSGTTLTILCSTGNATVYDLQATGGNVDIHGGPTGTVTVVGMSPALTVTGGSVTVSSGVTLITESAAPTILVSGGSLTIRGATIQESTSSAQAAILITGGTVDLGTTASPGSNILNVDGMGTLIENMTASPVPAVGDTFENNGVVVASNFGTVSLSAPAAQSANQGVSQPFSLGSLTDTVTDSQSWAVDVNWGDGMAHTDFSATSTGALAAQSHTFALPGTYTVTVTATDSVATAVSAWDLVDTFTVTVGQSMFILDPSAGGALSISGNATLNVPGAIVVDSISSSAVSASGNASVKAAVVDVHGKVQKSGNASFGPAPATGAPSISDPLANLPVPVASTLNLASKSSVSVSGNSSQTIGPGVYSQIAASGNASLTLQPGVYIIAGGGFTVSGNANVSVSGGSNAITGTGVMLFNAGSGYNATTGADGGSYGAITLGANGTVKLTAPSTGTYGGILLFQDRANAKPLTFSGNAMQGIFGTIYAPAARLDESGNATVGSTTNPISLIVDTLSLSGNAIANAVGAPPAGAVAYTPNQIRDAYGINALLGAGLDGTGQTISIVDAYDDPTIYQALDTFDSQFSLTDSGPTLYQQYGPASSCVTVLNQYGQATSLPSTDPNGPDTDNWEVEEALDVEWAHAIAPDAQIILVEANSQSLSDLMASVATAAAQPGVSVVSMSWGFPEGQAVFASDEATYDGVFNVPGVTFVASTGDYGAADPEYPAYSSNVVAVGGTSLALDADNSYNSETAWGYYSAAAGAYIASGGGISLYEPEPTYQQGVQSTGYRTTPDVSLFADPDTGAWIADPYNLDPSNPFEVVGGTSLSAPAWAGLIALANQGRVAAGESTLNSSTPSDAQQALYMLPQADYNVIASGNNGYSASAGYNLVTGLGTPVANLLVPDLISYHGPGTPYSGPTVAPLQAAGLVNSGSINGGPMDVFSVFDSLTVPADGFGFGRDVSNGASINVPFDMTSSGAASRAQPAGDLSQGRQALGLNSASNSSALVLTASRSAGGAGTQNLAVVGPAQVQQSARQPVMLIAAEDFLEGSRRAETGEPRGNPARTEPRPPGIGKYDLSRFGIPGELAAEIALVRAPAPSNDQGVGIKSASEITAGTTSILQTESAGRSTKCKLWLTDMLFAIGLCAHGTASLAAPGRRATYLDSKAQTAQDRTERSRPRRN